MKTQSSSLSGEYIITLGTLVIVLIPVNIIFGVYNSWRVIYFIRECFVGFIVVGNFELLLKHEMRPSSIVCLLPVSSRCAGRRLRPNIARYRSLRPA